MRLEQNNYKEKLKILSSGSKLNNHVFWSDMILDQLKWGAISASEAMVLSSHGENFGVTSAMVGRIWPPWLD